MEVDVGTRGLERPDEKQSLNVPAIGWDSWAWGWDDDGFRGKDWCRA